MSFGHVDALSLAEHDLVTIGKLSIGGADVRGYGKGILIVMGAIRRAGSINQLERGEESGQVWSAVLGLALLCVKAGEVVVR